MPFDPLFDKLPPKGAQPSRQSATAALNHSSGTATIAAPADVIPASPFTGKPMVAAKVAGVPVYVDLDSRAVYPVQT